MDSAFIGASQTLSIDVADKHNGIRQVWVAIFKDGKETVLLDKEFPSSNIFTGGAFREQSLDLPLDAEALGLKDGKAMLRMVARDYSWRKWGKGNQDYQEHEVLIDTTAPDISIESPALYLNQGGSGVVIYQLSEDCPTSGVLVGEDFFPGYGGHSKDPLMRIAFIALNYKQGKKTKLKVTATDFAGNQGVTGLARHINARRFKRDKISLNNNFLSWKMPEFSSQVSAPPNARFIDTFLKVNRDLRQKNFEEIVKITSKSEPRLYWKGHFPRLRGWANRAGFADHRSYIFKGKTVDKQVHLGIDLASYEKSEVPAANNGKVVFAQKLGIYGRTVIIDHGFGLFSLYAHLSKMNVSPGKEVSKGDVIGRTGKTGLAGGDHLHFSMLVHHTFVNPKEWWDPNWVKNNIHSKIESME